jgi:hypothetical protein
MARITKKNGESVWQQLKKELDLATMRQKEASALAKKALNRPTFFKWDL